MRRETNSIAKAFRDELTTTPLRQRGPGIRYAMDAEERALMKSEEKQAKEPMSLTKSILNLLNGGSGGSVERLAFERDPSIANSYGSLYSSKVRLLPDSLLKRIAIQDDLVASIVQVRTNQMTAHGRPRDDRFETGFVLRPDPGVLNRMTSDGKAQLDAQIKSAVDILNTCGETDGWSDADRCSFATWLNLSTRNAVVVGRLATEIIWAQQDHNAPKKFHSFRAIDAGTIYRAIPQSTQAATVRTQALKLLEQVKNKELVPERYTKDEYSWVQVIEGKPMQAFTAQECVVHNFYPVADVELDGYPVTPIDTMISAVTTHINITQHNKIYFQTGRATRGMLVIKSDDVDESVISRVKQQFNASINSVQNSWRMPVFGIGAQDEITWSAIDSGGRDMEFQYLQDCNARVIFSAFQMSPEEVAGWAYLSRGTNNQALSESNNEYRLTAVRDSGLRPLIAQFEDFINSVLLPLIDEDLAKKVRFKFVGLDEDTAEKESVRLQQDLPLHMTIDQVLQKVEKQPIGKEFGGEFLLNPQWHEVLDQHYTVGEIEEKFMGRAGASKDPSLAYRRDPFFFQWVQLQQAQQQAEAQQQQAAQGGGPAPGSEQQEAPGVSDEQSPGGQQMDAETEKQKSDKAKDASGTGDESEINTGSTGMDLSRSVDMAIDVLTKSEAQLPPSKRRLLAQHKKTISQALEGWENDLKEANDAIMSVAEHHAPSKPPKKN